MTTPDATTEALADTLVVMVGNRAAITDQTMVEIAWQAPDLADWVADTCEHDVFRQVWLLPVYDDE